jgi:CRISPR-associated protein Csm4
MPVVTVYRLVFSSGLHVGTRGVNLEESNVSIPSDTLFAALVDAYRRTGGDPAAFVAPFPHEGVPGNPPFLLTSAFPFAGEVRFFPVLVPLQRIFKEKTLKDRRKDIQKIRYLSESLWRRMTNGEQLDDWLFPEDEHSEPETGVALQGKTLWLTLEDCKGLPDQFQRDLKTRYPISPRALREHKVYMDCRVPRVTVDRINLASNIFHAGRVTFAPGCGLWLGVEWRAPRVVVDGTPYEQAFRQTLALLRDDGLGGERTSGYGAFTYEEKGPLALPDVQTGGLALLLSRYHPKTE